MSHYQKKRDVGIICLRKFAVEEHKSEYVSKKYQSRQVLQFFQLLIGLIMSTCSCKSGAKFTYRIHLEPLHISAFMFCTVCHIKYRNVSQCFQEKKLSDGGKDNVNIVQVSQNRFLLKSNFLYDFV